MYSLATCIKAAVILFPLLALGITLPYLIVHYHKYGSILLFRAVVFYSLILYLLCSYLLVVLPLPSLEEVAQLKTPSTQLIPFQFTNDIKMYTEFSVWTPKTYVDSFFNSVFLQVFYNVIMFIPFGIYLHYYYRRNLLETFLLSFMLSLFFELTQLTGIYGYYPRAYRLFDVDDLILNTVGGMVGYFIEPFFSWILPSKEQLNQISYERGKKVSVVRRLMGAIIDWSLIVFIFFIIKRISPFQWFDLILLRTAKAAFIYFVLVLIYFVFLPYFFGGYTPGKRIVQIKVVNKKNHKPGILQYFVRYMILYGLFVPDIAYCFWLNTFRKTEHVSQLEQNISFFLIGVLILLWILFAINLLIALFTCGKLFLYESLSNTQEVSTIKIPDED